MLCAVNGSHLFPAWCCGAVDDGTSHRCYQGYCDGVVSRYSVMDDVKVGVDAGADVGAGDDGTCSCHLAVPYCTLRNPLDLAPVSYGLERVGDKLALLKRDVQGIYMTKHSKRIIEASDLGHITIFYCQLKLHDACCHIDIFTREFYYYRSYMIL